MPLLQRLTSAISPTALSLLTSLKLNLELWPEESLHQLQGLEEVNRVKRFSMYGHILSQFTPANLPRLKKLSIEFTSDWHSDGWDLFTQSVAKVVPGKPERAYLLQPTDQIIEAFGGNLDLEVMLKPEHAYVVARKLGLANGVIRGIHPDGKSQYWKVWRDLPIPGKEEKAAWSHQGYWLFWDPYFQVPVGFVREEPGPRCQFTNGQEPWSWWTDGHGFVYRRTILELKLDWGVGMMGAGNNAATAGIDRRVWFPDVKRDWLPMRWLLERAL